MKQSELKQIIKEEITKALYKKSSSGWYLVTQRELYDRDFITIDTFITQTPEKYNDTELYIINPIKVK
jgi:hypothetical protein